MKRKRFWMVGLALALVLAHLPVRPAYAATITVNTTNDMIDAAGGCGAVTVASLPGPDGVISLREAICAANNNAGSDTIVFNIAAGCGAGGVCTIQPTSVLPTLTGGGTTIDGYTQPGALQATDTTSATLKIEIDGSLAGSISGLIIASADNVVKGLVINRFSGEGIGITNISAMSNTISGNYIGTDASGTLDQGNGQNGVLIINDAQDNTIGGDTVAERNVISGNGWSGVEIYDSATGNIVSGNYIGTDANGTLDLGNTGTGVVIGYGSHTVGGDTEGERNVISGNDGNGVSISGSGTMSNTISGNYIGTDASGTTDLGNTRDGIYIAGGAQSNAIGGNTAGERNVISGNGWYGVEIRDNDTMSNTVSGNYIGTDVSGTLDRGNTWDGVHIYVGAKGNTIGGDTTAERNVISGNGWSGVWIRDNGTMSNTVSGNYIGIDANDTTELGNDGAGVRISHGAQNNTVGLGNVIAHNGSDGVEMEGGSTSGNTITQNSIFSNTLGIDLVSGANGNIQAPVIVTTTVGSVNVVGTACPNCTVEVFQNSDTDGEGETYVGHATATAAGAFTVTVSSLSDPYLTATATKAISGTSKFSAVFTSTVTGGTVYLPIILKNY